ncbi:hypothetical protein LCM4576_23600 [Mesorhizobium sp. LCM 4576]|uniref:hypothetical protein n=1 Tax=Mesorhizobium sp. LCM 4576 TaxID=1848289 RepID=UPI0008D9EFFB|nr:hypothetical protein [Mesorhizobium sp. LCM 4576]OHV67905.1 hypothetical protein LCM4576_23600 [Mesorhizobium sp. LCM 4576]
MNRTGKGGTLPKLTNQDAARVVEALRAHAGIKTAAAAALKVGKTTLYAFLKAHPDVMEAAADVDEEILDLAESEVAKAIRAGDMATVRWFLELKGKDRGYVRRVENTGKDGGPIQTRQKPDLSEISDEELEILGRITAKLEGKSWPQ